MYLLVLKVAFEPLNRRCHGLATALPLNIAGSE